MFLVLSLALLLLVVLSIQIGNRVMLLLHISAEFQIFGMVPSKDLLIVCMMLCIGLPVIFVGD